jgi:hypothetical protein
MISFRYKIYLSRNKKKFPVLKIIFNENNYYDSNFYKFNKNQINNLLNNIEKNQYIIVNI